MIVGTILLALIAVGLLFGAGKSVFPKSWQRLVLVLAVFVVIILNLIPPYVSGITRLYIGSLAMAVGCLILLIVGGDRKQIMFNLLGLIAVASISFFYRVTIIQNAENVTFWHYVLMVAVGGLSAFIVGRKIRYAFSIGYLGVYLAGLFRNGAVGTGEAEIAYVNVGGGYAFSAMILTAVFAVVCGYLTNLLLVKKSTPVARESAIEASRELTEKPENARRKQSKKH